MSFLGLFNTTENERKQNEYDKLHNKILDALSDHEKYINKAKEALSSYKSKAPNLSNSKIPSNYFEPHRERLTEELEKYISYEEEKKLELLSAKESAYQRYLHYKQQVYLDELKKQEEGKKSEQSRNSKR